MRDAVSRNVMSAERLAALAGGGARVIGAPAKAGGELGEFAAQFSSMISAALKQRDDEWTSRMTERDEMWEGRLREMADTLSRANPKPEVTVQAAAPMTVQAAAPVVNMSPIIKVPPIEEPPSRMWRFSVVYDDDGRVTQMLAEPVGG